MRVANQMGLGPYHGVAADGGVRANPSLGGVDEGDALSHELVVDAVAGDGGELSQLGARVDAKAVAVVFAVVDAHGMAGGFKDLEHVGQVVLALRVIAGDIAYVGGKQGAIEGIAPGVAFKKLRGLLRRAILLLDDARDHTVAIELDAAVAKGVGRGHGEDGGRKRSVRYGLGEHANGIGLDKRKVAVEDHHGTGIDAASVQSDAHSMAGAQALGLLNSLYLHGRLRVCLAKDRADLVCMAANNNDDALASGLDGCVYNPLDHGLAQDLVAYLCMV